MLQDHRTSRSPTAEAGPTRLGEADLQLVQLAESYGAEDPAAWLDAEGPRRPAAARRALLLRLRNDRRLAPPPLGSIERLQPPPRAPHEVEHPLETLDDVERAVLVGALLDGLDATALADALHTNRNAIKGIARRLLRKLDDGQHDGEPVEDGVATLMAGEYALGLLQPAAQVLFERGLAHDPDLQKRVEAWDARFAALVAPTAPAPWRRQQAAAERAAATPGGRRFRWLWVGSIAGLAVLALVLARTLGPEPWRRPMVLPEARPAPAAAPSFDEAREVPPAGQSLPLAAPTEPLPDTPPPLLASADVDGGSSGAQPVVGARVLLHHGSGAEGAARAAGVVDQLVGAGVEIGLVGATETQISRDRVRFFHSGDRSAAASLRETLGAGGVSAELQDFTHYRPLPPPGTVEIWLSSAAP